MIRDYFDFYSWDGTFYDTLKERVEKAVPRDKRRFHWKMYTKSLIILLSWIYSTYWYITCLTFWSAIAMAITGAQVGVNIMHDGNHFAYSKSNFWNRCAGFSLELLGTSAIIYKRSHNFGHHGCVNHLELDRAFDTTYPMLRFHPGLPWHDYHQY